ncbi:hypothetical protein ACWEOG_18805 [Amycolatopsis japonica]
MSTSTTPRVWLAAGVADKAAPSDHPVVRDDLMHLWFPGGDGLWHTADNRHHAAWTELHARFDLVEVITR